MDWDDLRYFLAIYRCGSTSGAARELAVQHSTVGRRLAGLEQALGTGLFTRTPTGLVPTEAAEDIFRHAEAAERSIQAVERNVGGSDRRLEGVVRLTTSEAFSGYFVRKLAKLHVQVPGIAVEILGGNRVFDLSRGEADLAVRIAATPQLDLICRCVGHAGWSLYASQAYLDRRGAPKSIEDLRGHELIGFDDSLGYVPGAQWIASHSQGISIPIRGNSINAAINAAIAGIGIAIVPCFLGSSEATLHRLSADRVGTREIWLVFHPDRQRIARVRRVIDFLVDEITADREFLYDGTAIAPSATT